MDFLGSRVIHSAFTHGDNNINLQPSSTSERRCANMVIGIHRRHGYFQLGLHWVQRNRIYRHKTYLIPVMLAQGLINTLNPVPPALWCDKPFPLNFQLQNNKLAF